MLGAENPLAPISWWSKVVSTVEVSLCGGPPRAGSRGHASSRTAAAVVHSLAGWRMIRSGSVAAQPEPAGGRYGDGSVPRASITSRLWSTPVCPSTNAVGAGGPSGGQSARPDVELIQCTVQDTIAVGLGIVAQAVFFNTAWSELSRRQCPRRRDQRRSPARRCRVLAATDTAVKKSPARCPA